MKFYFIIIFFLSHVARAEVVRGHIISLELGSRGQDHLLKLNTGRVIFLENKDAQQKFLKTDTLYDLMTDKKNYLVNHRKIKEIHEGQKSARAYSFMPKPFSPTILKDSVQAKNIFLRMRRNYKKDGQCFNRAHVWTFEEFRKYNTKLEKIFIFFTDRYIRLYRFHWWFHVSPMTYVGKFPRVLDRRYSSGPLTTKTWTDIFMKSKHSCLLIDKYSDYFLNQESQHCFLHHASMYQVIPRDLEKLELYGEGKEFFFKSEIDRAYRDAFLTAPN